MLTTPAPTVNSALPLPLPGVMMRVGEIATRDGISAPAVSAKVKRLVANHGLQVQTNAAGRVTAVNVVQYDQLLNRYDDPAKDQKPGAMKGSLDDARTRAAYYSGELDRLKLSRELGELLPRANVEFAVEEAGDQIARAFESLTGTADDLVAAFESGGQQALRIKLKELVHQARSTAAEALDKLIAAAPETIAVMPAEGSPA